MSNSYLQFSEALVLKSDEEKKWFERYVAASYTGGEGWDDIKPVSEEAKWWNELLAESQEDMACFEWNFTDIEGKSCVVLYSEDAAIVEHAAKLVQHFFKEMRPEGKDGFSISWAEICDKSLPGQFGGGACMVTKDEIHWLNTWQWLTDLAEHLHVE